MSDAVKTEGIEASCNADPLHTFQPGHIREVIFRIGKDPLMIIGSAPMFGQLLAKQISPWRLVIFMRIILFPG